MAALPSPAPGRPPAGAIATMAAARARRLKEDLTSSQPTKDDHRGNQTEQNGNRDATELACGCGVFPAVQPRAMPRRYGASYRRGGLKRWPLLVLEPSARTIAAWQRRTNVCHKATSPCEGAKRLRNRTANDGYSDEKMCPCHGKLGLGVRSRNVWNGRWWVHVLYCSTHCGPFMSWSDMTP